MSKRGRQHAPALNTWNIELKVRKAAKIMNEVRRAAHAALLPQVVIEDIVLRSDLLDALVVEIAEARKMRRMRISAALAAKELDLKETF